MPSSISDPREAIRARALTEGFDVVRFTRAVAPEGSATRLGTFLGEGRHGSMEWMARNIDRRADPQTLWAEAKSIIVLGANYGPDHDPLDALSRTETGAISVYAQGSDYHDILKARLKRLASHIAETFDAGVKVFIDTAPVLEKPLAQQAGVGWQGKHTNLVSREFGSWLFLGSVFTTLEIEPDAAHADRCGQCHACLDICPTQAFPAPYQLDARRCISYLTIEHQGPIPRELRPLIGNRIFGCDDCLAVCPWNKYAQGTTDSAFLPRAELTAPRLAELARLDDAGFRSLFAGTAVKRTGRDRFVRNVLIAIGNAPSPTPELIAAAASRLEDACPLVRGAAIWALGRIAPETAAAAASRVDHEADPDVRAEWRHIRAVSARA